MATTKVRVTYTEQENEAIAAYAQSSAAKDGEVTVRSARDTAIAAHRALFARVRETGGTLPYGNAHFEFMREVDTPAPDYGLRATYRKQIIEAATQPANLGPR